MATIVTDTSLVMGMHEDRRETVTFAGTDTFVYGTIFARSTASGKLIPYVKGGASDGNGVPVAVLLEPDGITRTGAGDVTGALVLTAGKVRKDKLVIDADGNSSNIDNVVMSLLQSQAISVTTALDHAVANNF